MKTPVVTTQGHTYDTDYLLCHFNKNGNYDPITRVPIN